MTQVWEVSLEQTLRGPHHAATFSEGIFQGECRIRGSQFFP